jgi:hypothetical protein
MKRETVITITILTMALGLFGCIGNKKNEPIKSYAGFWNWVQDDEKTFFKMIIRKMSYLS